VRFLGHVTLPRPGEPAQRDIEVSVTIDGAERTIAGSGNGPIAAYVDALRRALALTLDVRDFREHARGQGADAAAVAYVEIVLEDGRSLWGAGLDTNTVTASLKAVTSAVNRALAAAREVLSDRRLGLPLTPPPPQVGGLRNQTPVPFLSPPPLRTLEGEG
jgi:2-isopropylmalate synthase